MLLSHYFLPKFIKLIKARKQIVTENTDTLVTLKTKFELKQNILHNLIENNFVKLRLMLEKEVLLSIKENTLLNFKFMSQKIATVLYHNVLYYDTIILKLVPVKLNC